MELVYIWVEKYKNIILKGFNLSSRFECTYEANNLILKRKKYPEIFPENINLTAFIGTNGSGKTSLLEIIQLLCFESVDVSHTDEHIWAIFYDKLFDKFYFDNLMDKNIMFTSIQIKDKNDNDITADYETNGSIIPEYSKYYFNYLPKNIFYNISYNPSIELVSSHFINYINSASKEFYGHIYDLDFKPDNINIFSFPSKKQGNINIKKNENTIILNMFKTINIVKPSLYSEIFDNDKLLFIPTKVSFEIDFNDLEYNIKQNYIKEIVFKNQLTLNIRDLARYFLAMIFSTIQILKRENQGFTEYFLKDDSIIKMYLIEQYKKVQADYTDYNAVLKIIYENIYNNIDEFIELTKEIKLFDSLREDSRLNSNVYDLAKLIDTMNEYNINTFPNTTSNRDKILVLLENLPSFVTVEVYNQNRVNFNDFSYGEKNIVQLLYSLLYYIMLLGKNKVLNIILDEIELGLNPKWQKELMNTLITILKMDIFSDIRFNIFLSSHSPFILSDIPKDNVVFLKNGIQDFPFSKNEETFGANIHQLLSHGFFMENGLMGEYAKNEIDDLIKNLKKKDFNPSKVEKDNMLSTIKIIGEEFLKIKLLDMYYKKFDDDYIKEKRREELIKQKEQIDKELQNL